MVRIQTFEVERWMDETEHTPGVLNIAETCSESISVQHLAKLHSAGEADAPPIVDLSAVMTYGAIPGSEALRRNIAALYADDAIAPSESVRAEDIIVTQGAIGANHLVLYTLIGPGDHVVCIFPTYQQLYALPETLGAEVSLWKLKAEDQYVPDVAELEKLIKNNTKMIIMNNPNNPTGAVSPKSVLEKIVELAQKYDLILLSDEVYRPLFHSLRDQATPPPSMLSFGGGSGYQKILATSSMSKAWALAGIRLGWIATRDARMREELISARDYTTISVSQLDDQVARYALSDAVRPALLARNIGIARDNLALLDGFVQKYADVCSWVKPVAGTTAFLKFSSARNGEPVDDAAFCRDVLDKTKVLMVPGDRCFGQGDGENAFRGFVRVGYVNNTKIVREALEKLGAYLDENLR